MTKKESETSPLHGDTSPPRPRVEPPPRRERTQQVANARIAQRIAQHIAPRTALDAGCSTGLLVAGLRQRGVEATGIRLSSGEFEPADPSIRPFLFAGSLAEPLPQTYDLIVCLEALNDMPDGDAEAVVANLCRHTRDVLFSARPDPDAAHPRRPDVWAGMFARRGFFRDPDFDASFIALWAVRFQKTDNLDLEQAVRGYEARFWTLWQENARLREKVRAQEQALNQAHLEYDTVTTTLASRLGQWESIWADVEKSAGWRFIHRVRRLRLWLAPPGSRRSALLRIARDSVSVQREQGLGAFLSHWRRGLNSPEFRFAPGQKTIEQINAEAYPDFVRRTTPNEAERARQREDSRGWRTRPLISFITPVYQPPVSVLRALLDSVLAQSYENWELCIADASPNSPDVHALLEEYSARNARIKVQFLPQNLGICGNSNAAIRKAQGEYIAILDHDDVIPPNMLYEVARRVQENHFADVIYFDEDKLSEDGMQRRAPFFKPDFSPEMLLSANYLMHAVYRRALVDEAGGFDPAFEGCQDWDLAFKVTERTKQIEHIPQVLYHWRQVSGSTAGDFGAKAYVFERQLQCVQDHLRRVGLEEAEARFQVPGFLRATWPASGKKVTIIIPTKDRVDFLKRTVESLQSRTRYPDYEIVIVDNDSGKASTLKYLDRLRSRTDVKIVDYREKFNYSRANNLGVQHATGDIFLFLNNDVEILEAGWLEEMVRWVDRPQVGIVGAKLLYPDDSIQHAGVVVGMEGHASHVFWGYRERQSGPFGSVDWYRNFTAVTGACMMIRREVFETLGGFAEKYILAFSDIELCMRVIDLGYRVVYTPHARLHHFEGKSRGDHIPSNDIRVGIEDFMPLVERGDPFYNPNLSYVERKPAIRPEDEEDRVARLLRVAAGAKVNDLISES